jgi:hypothetical protein
MLKYYMRNEQGEVTATTDVLVWGLWMEHNWRDRRIADTTLPGGERVSTVFLGLDHGFHWHLEPNPPPVLWELMVFAPEGHYASDYQERFATEAEARKRHDEVVRLLLSGLPLEV